MNGNNAQKEQAVKLFLTEFLATYSPEVYAAVMEQVPEAAQAIATPPGMEGIMGLGYGFGQVPQATQATPEDKPWWEKVLGAAAGIGESYFQYKAQKDVLKIQQKRAEQGLAPITTEAYAPTIRHAVDIPPELKQAAVGTGTLMALGLGALALMFFATR